MVVLTMRGGTKHTVAVVAKRLNMAGNPQVFIVFRATIELVITPQENINELLL